MNNKTWNGLITIVQIQHLDKNGKCLWEDNNLRNMLHYGGEQFVLTAIFSSGNTTATTTIPDNYYFGLDTRSTLAAADDMSAITGEPSINGYARQSVSSTGQFVVSFVGGVYQAKSPILTFTASTGPWGPVKNLFMTNKSDNSGYLISSAPLSQTITVAAGESVTMRLAMSLRDCP